MAKVLGESGRYATQEEIKKFRQHYLAIISAIAILGVVLGYILCLELQVREFSSFSHHRASFFNFVQLAKTKFFNQPKNAKQNDNRG